MFLEQEGEGEGGMGVQIEYCLLDIGKDVVRMGWLYSLFINLVYYKLKLIVIVRKGG